MTDQELIQALRNYGLSNGSSLGRHMGIMDAAADVLAALQADNEKKDKEIERLKEDVETLATTCLTHKNTIDYLQSELNSAKAERDEAALGGVGMADDKLHLAMLAGARAIERNKRLLGASYCYDVFGEFGGPKEINYYEAAQLLREAGGAAQEIGI